MLKFQTTHMDILRGLLCCSPAFPANIAGKTGGCLDRLFYGLGWPVSMHHLISNVLRHLGPNEPYRPVITWKRGATINITTDEFSVCIHADDLGRRWTVAITRWPDDNVLKKILQFLNQKEFQPLFVTINIGRQENEMLVAEATEILVSIPASVE